MYDAKKKIHTLNSLRMNGVSEFFSLCADLRCIEFNSFV